MAQLRVEWFVQEGRMNALMAWTFAGIAIAAAVSALITGNVIRAGGAALLVFVAVIPAIAGGSWRRMFRWPLMVIITLPAHFVAYGQGFISAFAASISLATFALAVVVDLHILSNTKMSTGFTAAFIVIATMGFAGFWAVFAWTMDIYFATGFVATNTALMIDFLITTGTGLCIALGFEWYARQQVNRRGNPPEEVVS